MLILKKQLPIVIKWKGANAVKIDDRKLAILAAVVDEYIKTGEPVGSKTILTTAGLGVSSATIRNDMAALEKMGFLEHPHTSAGRVPTYYGYRMYIERLMSPHMLTSSEKREIDQKLLSGGATAQSVIQNAADLLSDATGLAVVNADNLLHFSVITRVEVVPAGHKLYALLMITSTGAVKNKLCRLEFELTPNQMEFFTQFVQQNLRGINVDHLTPAMLQNMAIALGGYMISLSPLLYAIYEMGEEFTRSNVRVRGEQKLLNTADIDSREILRFIHERQELANLLNGAMSGLQVLFGKENDVFAVTNSSMIVTPYQIGQKQGGALGVIGPVRLDYKKVIPYTQYFSDSITRILSEIVTEENENGSTKPND